LNFGFVSDFDIRISDFLMPPFDPAILDGGDEKAKLAEE